MERSVREITHEGTKKSLFPIVDENVVIYISLVMKVCELLKTPTPLKYFNRFFRRSSERSRLSSDTLYTPTVWWRSGSSLPVTSWLAMPRLLLRRWTGSQPSSSTNLQNQRRKSATKIRHSCEFLP